MSLAPSDSTTVLVPFARGGDGAQLDATLASIPSELPRLVLEHDGELAEALNAGLEAATTELVFRLDAGDVLQPDLIPSLVEAIWDVDVAYPELLIVDEEARVVDRREADEFCPNRLLVESYIPAGALARREAVLEVGGYRPLEGFEHWDLWVRMMRAGKRFKANFDASFFHLETERVFPSPEIRAHVVREEPELRATWYVQETIATTYWRALLPARHLPGQVIKHRPRVEVIEDEITFPNHRGAAVWQFPGHDYERFTMAAMQECGIPVLMETDDNYLVPDPFGRSWVKEMPTPETRNLNPSYALHRQVCTWVDGITVTTEQLARQYRKVTDAPVYVCPNQIDPADWPRRMRLPGEDKIIVGWAGSASHIVDTKLVAQALRWAGEQPNVEVWVFGVVPRDLKGVRYKQVPWTNDISAFRQLQGMVDIALAPVVENPWSACRSDVKALEYLMAGACPVLSDVIPYRDWKDGVGCRKAGSARDFLKVTRELVRDIGLARSLAQEGKEHVLAERTVAKNVWRWQEALETPRRG